MITITFLVSRERYTAWCAFFETSGITRHCKIRERPEGDATRVTVTETEVGSSLTHAYKLLAEAGWL